MSNFMSKAACSQELIIANSKAHKDGLFVGRADLRKFFVLLSRTTWSAAGYYSRTEIRSVAAVGLSSLGTCQPSWVPIMGSLDNLPGINWAGLPV